MTKKLTKPKQQHETLEGYDQLLNDIKSILQKGLLQAYKAVDNIRVQKYWQVGERVVREELKHKDRADYGERIIERLSIDLGFIKRDIYRMVRFYKTYPIVTRVASQLSWSHYIELIQVTQEEKRQFYEIQSIKNIWSRDELRYRIKSNEFA